MISSDLAIHGGPPVRQRPLPLEFPGVHHMGEEEVAAAVRVLRSRSPFRYYGVNLGGEADALEREFAAAMGTPHALAVSSGTGALHTALSALGVEPGQEVIGPAYLWVSVASAVVNLGAVPVVADIDDTFCLDPAAVAGRITPRTAGIIFVHMSGAPGDVKPVCDLARDRGLFLLEDCAQCAGGTLDGDRVGSFGDMAVFSFQMNKNMTAGEGGMVVTASSRLYQRAFACHDMGYPRDAAGRLVLDQPDLAGSGRGYRMDEIRAAVLRVQLAKLPAIVAAMRHSKRRIRAAIADLPGVRLRRLPDPAGDTGCFLITTYRDAETACEVNRALRAEGIVTHPQGISNIVMTGWGLHLYYNNVNLVRRFPHWAKGACPAADDLFARSILLPIPSCLSVQDEDDIIHAFARCCRFLGVNGGCRPGGLHE
jgi:8-amino-3,8-dideoxy-alpha-D-manno-octulosonate transaminase